MAVKGSAPNLVGRTFGRLTVLEYAGWEPKNRKHLWICECSCGTVVTKPAGNLLSGNTKSCGCYRRDFSKAQTGKLASGFKHGKSRSAEYQAWLNMIGRCYRPTCVGYSRYGGRGITVCNDWLESFERFYADMGDRPGPGYSLERKNNDLNYSSENCRWATDAEQNRNRSDSIRVTLFGRTKCVAEWAREFGISKHTIYNRLKKGWSPFRAVITGVTQQESRR